MNLAIKDIRHNPGRVTMTTFGVGMLLLLVMGMAGMYQGFVDEAVLVVDRIGADLWIVQRDTRGPFAEISRVPPNLVHRALAVPGVQTAREFVYHTIQREHRGKPMRVAVLGLGWPADKGEWLPLVAGRPLARNHYEMIADQVLGLQLGERIVFGKDTYTVVGITRNMVGSGGDGIGFFTVRDAQAIQFDVPGEAVRLERASRLTRGERTEVGAQHPLLVVEQTAKPAAELPAVASPQLSAVIVTLAPGANIHRVASIMSGWSDVSVYTHESQRQLGLRAVDRPRRQLRLFRVLLTVIAGVILALILYMQTMEKVLSIALLKLIGAPNRVILGLILQQGMVMGLMGYGMAYLLGLWVFPMFPRRVVLTGPDLLQLGAIVVVISAASSLLGIWKAMRVSPNEVLS
ncbi:MAG: ABC transporter permease [Nitrospirales bacterium]